MALCYNFNTHRFRKLTSALRPGQVFGSNTSWPYQGEFHYSNFNHLITLGAAFESRPYICSSKVYSVSFVRSHV